MYSTPDLQPVSSSNLRAVGYDPFTQTLIIAFKSGGRYRYDGVPPDVHSGLMMAGSRGRYFYGRIRDRYPTTKLYG